MTDMIRTRDKGGRWLPGFSGRPEGRLPRQTETQYLEVTMGAVSVDKWAEIVERAVEDALCDKDHTRARAREWLAKHLIGDPATIQQFLYKEERSFTINVIFGNKDELPETIEHVMIDAD